MSEAFLIEVSSSAEETFSLGQRIAARLVPGSVIALNGKLGSGKTVLAKGIAGGLGINETVTSPTYTIISEYLNMNHTALYHIDAYRLNGDEDFEQIGGIEIVNGNGICIIEWSERIQKSLPHHTIYITLEITGVASRLINITGLEMP